ncbi:MAG: Na+/H+ antiporter NhaC family protein [Gemmatimonadota bacterium]
MPRRFFLLLFPALLPGMAGAQEVTNAPAIFVDGIPFTIEISAASEAEAPYRIEAAGGRILAEGTLAAGGSEVVGDLLLTGRNDLPLRVILGPESREVSAPFIPGWFSLLPPLVAILLALLLKEVVISLLAGVWLGALAISGFNPLAASWRVVDEFVVPALGDTGGQTQIVVFSLLLGGMVGVITRNGGTRGIVNLVVRWATTRKRGKLAVWGAGLAIFFDDYANTLIVGNAMRPITDRLRISREKLAYLVDSTAAPVAALVPISTWVGYQISLIQDGLQIAADQPGTSPEAAASLLAASPFTVFLHTIPYLFYPLLALFLVFLTSWMNRDFGAMAAAENRAASGGGLFRPGATLAADTSDQILDPDAGTPERWPNAALPVLTVVIVVLAGLYTTGRASTGAGASLMDIFGAADPFVTLLWGSFAGCAVAFILSLGERILTLQQTVHAWISGMRAMLPAIVILVLAWSLGSVTEIVGTAPYLSQLLNERLPLALLPAIVFVTAAAISFATGTSWGTMAILLPVVIPLTVSLGGGVDFDGGTHYSILLGAISSVLAGAIFGDHCSPISDTTVLSSMAAGCDHVDHVRTQLPYAVTVAAITVPLGDVATGYGLPNWVALAAGAFLLYALVRWLGTPVPEDALPAPTEIDRPAPAG